MNTLITKFQKNWKNINWPKMSIYSISLSGVFLSIVASAKLLDNFMPKAPIGVSIWEIYITILAISVLVLPWGPSFMVTFLAPFIFMAMGQTWIVSPFSFFLDYSLPMLSMIIIKFSKNKWWVLIFTILAFALKYFSHSLSGVLFYKTNWITSLSSNFLYVGVTCAITMVCGFLGFNNLSQLRKNYSYHDKKNVW